MPNYFDLGFNQQLYRGDDFAVLSDPEISSEGLLPSGISNLVTDPIFPSQLSSGEFVEHLILARDGHIRGGATDYNVGTGFWLGYDLSDDIYKFFIGTAAGNKLTWDGTTLSITGTLTATAGTIGGWSITSTTIQDAAGVVGMSSAVTGADDIRFWAGDATPASAEFRVTESGALTATSATITGSITATSGTIGGWTINATSITDAAGVVGLSSAITGGDDIRFWAGDATPASAEFRVTEAGALTATSATITGAITATSGDIGGWVVISGYLYNLQSGTPTSSPNDGVVLASGNEGIIIYEDTEKRVEVGYLSAGVYGLKGYATDGTTVLFELSDTQVAIAGWTISSTTLANSTNIILDASNKAISINNATFGQTGIQLQYNAGTPRMHVGSTTKYLQFDGTNVNMVQGVVDGTTTLNAVAASTIQDRAESQYTKPMFYVGRFDDGSTETTSLGTITRTFLNTSMNASAAINASCRIVSGVIGRTGSSSNIEFNTFDLEFSITGLCSAASANQDIFWGLYNGTGQVAADATDTTAHIGFYIQDGTLFASNANGTTQTTTDISSGVTLTNNNHYRFVYNVGTNITFYVNDTLKATHTTNMPTSGGPRVHIDIQVSTANERTIHIRNNYVVIASGP